MTDHPKPDFIELCGVLNAHRVEYLVLGGWAGILYGLPRTTQDVDLFIPEDRENCSRLIAGLSTIGFGIARELTPDDILSRAALLFADQIRIDVFVHPPGVPPYPKVAERKREFEVCGVRIPVISLDDLISSKRGDRPQDRADHEALLAIRGRRGGESAERERS